MEVLFLSAFLSRSLKSGSRIARRDKPDILSGSGDGACPGRYRGGCLLKEIYPRFLRTCILSTTPAILIFYPILLLSALHFTNKEANSMKDLVISICHPSNFVNGIVKNILKNDPKTNIYMHEEVDTSGREEMIDKAVDYIFDTIQKHIEKYGARPKSITLLLETNLGFSGINASVVDEIRNRLQKGNEEINNLKVFNNSKELAANKEKDLVPVKIHLGGGGGGTSLVRKDNTMTTIREVPDSSQGMILEAKNNSFDGTIAMIQAKKLERSQNNIPRSSTLQSLKNLKIDPNLPKATTVIHPVSDRAHSHTNEPNAHEKDIINSSQANKFPNKITTLFGEPDPKDQTDDLPSDKIADMRTNEGDKKIKKM